MGGEEGLAGGVCLGLSPDRLPDGDRENTDMIFLKHLGRLLMEFFGFAWHNKAWWIVPMVLVLLLLALLIVTGQSTAPFIYTLF